MASGAYNRFKANLFNGLLDLSGNSGSDTIKVALLDNSHAFDADDDVWTDVSANEISGTGYSAGGETLANQTVTQDDTNDLAKFDADDVQWTTASFTASHAVLYDNSVSDNLIASIDFGGAKTVSGGTFTISWNSNGIVRLT